MSNSLAHCDYLTVPKTKQVYCNVRTFPLAVLNTCTRLLTVLPIGGSFSLLNFNSKNLLLNEALKGPI